MQTIGNYLKSGREARNIQLSEVAQSTKISKWYLDCLENDEFDKIPGGPYIKGYITSYASFIGIEEDDILRRYDSLQTNKAEEDAAQDQIEYKKRRSWPDLLFSRQSVMTLGLLAIGLLAYLGFNHFYSADKIPVFSADKAPLGSVEKTPGVTVDETTPVTAHPETAKKPALSADTSAETKPSNPEVATAAVLPADLEIEKSPQTSLLENAELQSPAKIDHAPVVADTSPSSEDAGLSENASTKAVDTLERNAVGSKEESGPRYGSESGKAGTPAKAADNLNVVRAVATVDITDKNPEAPVSSFDWSTERVYVWSMVECKRPPASIRHIYYFEGRKVNDIELEVNAPQWRTWSYKTLSDQRYIGRWKVDITTGEGKLLKSISFNVN